MEILLVFVLYLVSRFIIYGSNIFTDNGGCSWLIQCQYVGVYTPLKQVIPPDVVSRNTVQSIINAVNVGWGYSCGMNALNVHNKN